MSIAWIVLGGGLILAVFGVISMVMAADLGWKAVAAAWGCTAAITAVIAAGVLAISYGVGGFQ